jgi:hypothetical protein
MYHVSYSEEVTTMSCVENKMFRKIFVSKRDEKWAVQDVK